MDEVYVVGDSCPNCLSGILESYLDGCCSCHIHPPCSYCVNSNNYLQCSVCLEDPYEYLPKQYEVIKYWDNIFDEVVVSNLTLPEAEDKVRSLRRNIYTTFGVRKTPPTLKIFTQWLTSNN